MEGAARGDYRREVAEREVRQRTNKESWRHRCQNVLEPLVEMLREHLAERSRNNKGVSLTQMCPGSRRSEGLVWWGKREETSCARGRPLRLPDIQLFWGGDRGGNGGGVVTGSTGEYWWLWSGHRQWVPCKSEGGREQRGKAGGAEEHPVGTETEELDHEDSVGPWPLFPWRKREIRRGSKKRTEWAVTRGECKSLSSGEATTRPLAAARAGRKTLFCGGQILWRGQRSTCGFGARPSWRRDGWPDSERVSGSLWRRPSGPRSYSELFWGAWSEAQQKLHLQDNIFLFGAGTICSSCNAWLFFVYIYVLHTNLTAYATFYHSEHCLWINAFNASHRVRNKPYDHRLHKGISQSDSTESHSFRQGSSSFRCLSSGLFFPYAALHVLKHSTTSFTGTGGFVNICPTPAVAIDTWMESSSRQNENRKFKFSFRKRSKLNFDLYFDLCRSVEFTLVSSISILH